MKFLCHVANTCENVHGDYMEFYGVSMEFSCVLLTSHENSVEYFTLNSMEYRWKISPVYLHM